MSSIWPGGLHRFHPPNLCVCRPSVIWKKAKSCNEQQMQTIHMSWNVWEFGSCESTMAWWFWYLHPFLPSSLSLPPYLPTSLPPYLPTSLPTPAPTQPNPTPTRPTLPYPSTLPYRTHLPSITYLCNWSDGAISCNFRVWLRVDSHSTKELLNLFWSNVGHCYNFTITPLFNIDCPLFFPQWADRTSQWTVH